MVGRRWFVDETYVKVAGRWRYVYRAVDQQGQVVDVFVSSRRDIDSARRFFTTAMTAHGEPDEVVTDRAPALAHIIEELLPDACHNTGRYATDEIVNRSSRVVVVASARSLPRRHVRRVRRLLVPDRVAA